MTENTAKKSRSAKLNRSETVTIRLDPKLKYFAELAAKKQRRTLSSYIELAVEDSLKNTTLSNRNDHDTRTIADEISNLWDVYEPDRFAKLAFNYPNMLTLEEQMLWKLICENGLLWRGHYGNKGQGEWQWTVKEDGLIFERLREHWDKFEKVAKEEAGKDTLPSWNKFDPDVIPF